jgi:hypothetical protein
MHKGKVGLQKEISKIFTGVQIPKKGVSEADTRPVVAAPTKYIPPKPVAPAPKPFTIPEPTHAPKQTVYEPPPSPVPAPAPVRQPKPEPTPRPPMKMPFLKIWEKVKGKLLASQPGANQGRQKVMILMTPVLAMVFIIVLIQVLRTPARSAAGLTTKTASSGTAAFSGKIDWELPPLYPEILRDPMSFGANFTQAQNQTQEEASKLVVKGIVYSEDNPVLLLANELSPWAMTSMGRRS